MENVTKVSGTCAYCGQAVFIQPKVGEELSEHDLDMMATDMCTCAQASSERRKRERKETIDKFIKKHFAPEHSALVRSVIQMTEAYDLTDFRCKLPNENTVRIWLDSDAFLHIRIKKDSDEELKV